MNAKLHQQLLSENYYKLFLSKAYGGSENSLPEAVDIINALSREDGDLGWLVAIGSGGNYFCGYLDTEVAKKIYLPANALIAGSGATTGTATKTEGGWFISGEWKYSSGCLHATCFTFNCLIENSDQKISVAIDPNSVTIHEDWNSIGLRHTDTHTVSVDQIFVKDDHVFNILEEKNINHPAQSFPFLEFAVLCFIPVVDGLLQKMITLSKDICESRNWSVEAIEEIEDNRSTRWEDILELCNQSWSLHLRKERDEDLNAELIEKCIEHNLQCRLEATQLFGNLGMAVLYEDHPLNKSFRDLLTASQHSLLRNN